MLRKDAKDRGNDLTLLGACLLFRLARQLVNLRVTLDRSGRALGTEKWHKEGELISWSMNISHACQSAQFCDESAIAKEFESPGYPGISRREHAAVAEQATSPEGHSLKVSPQDGLFLTSKLLLVIQQEFDAAHCLCHWVLPCRDKLG